MAAILPELVELPAAAPIDGTLRAVVGLRNTSAEPVSLAPCPVYRLAYGESGRVVDIRNELNCVDSPRRGYRQVVSCCSPPSWIFPATKSPAGSRAP